MKTTIVTTIFLTAASFTMAQTTPQVGSTAPAVNLPSNDGRQVSLNDYKGKWVVLYFYPKDFTSGCTLEAQNFQRDLAKYQNASAIIL
jgi:peroxiredoxin Q/BCP